MGLLIDSSVLIDLERRDQPVSTLKELDEPLAMSSIVLSEFLFGLHRAATPQQRNRRQAFIEEALDLIEVLPFDQQAATMHARIWADLATSGQLIGPHDFIIAATALAYKYTLLTLNIREFSRIPGLEVRQPAW
jgi:tRNA(fMet)-specific endonuclease VapC